MKSKMTGLILCMISIFLIFGGFNMPGEITTYPIGTVTGVIGIIILILGMVLLSAKDDMQ